MLEFLKKLFKTEQELINIDESNLESWFNTQYKEFQEKLNEKLKLPKYNIEQELEKTKQNLTKLKQASLRNPNILIKEKQYMHGNREAYVRRVLAFVDNIKIDDSSYENIINFVDSFVEGLNLMGKSTFREYSVLQHFFSNEVRDIALNIKTLETNIKQLKTIIQESGYSNLVALNQSIQDYFSQKKIQASISTEIDNSTNKIQDLTKEKSNINAQISQTESSPEYKQVKLLEDKYSKLQKKVKEHESVLINLFSPLSAALKKYSRVSLEDEKLIIAYTENPVKALLSDNSLKILTILDSLGKSLISLSLKDKKREKTISTINKLDETVLRSWLNEMNNLSSQKSILSKELEANQLNSKLDNLRSNLVAISERIHHIEQTISASRSGLEKINLNELIKEIEKKIRLTLNLEIKIT